MRQEGRGRWAGPAGQVGSPCPHLFIACTYLLYVLAAIAVPRPMRGRQAQTHPLCSGAALAAGGSLPGSNPTELSVRLGLHGRGVQAELRHEGVQGMQLGYVCGAAAQQAAGRRPSCRAAERPHLQVAQLELAVLDTQRAHKLFVSLPRRLAQLFVQQGGRAALLQEGFVATGRRRARPHA